MPVPTHTPAHLVANMRLSESGGGDRPPTSMRELASGVDALYLSARGVVSPALLAHLEDRRSWAQEVKRAAPCEIGPLTFGIAPHGWGKYRFCLDHANTRIGITTSRRLPTIRVQPRAQYLHAVGPAAVVDAVHELLAPDFGELTFSVARVDLFADWQGFALTAADAGRFVCRADARRTYEHAGTLTGFDFGSRSTHTFTARIYDKTAETAGKGADWWTQVWGGRYVPGQPVIRVEFEVGRQALREFGLDTPAQVLAAAGDLWAYASGQWLTFRSPTADRTRSRWPLAPGGGPCRRPPWSIAPSASNGGGTSTTPRRCAACCPASPATSPPMPPSSAPTTSTTPSLP